jgi:gamma-glutamylcyclotransferase (GGCT)/AIG2-like uncharacterized protein YtfP
MKHEYILNELPIENVLPLVTRLFASYSQSSNVYSQSQADFRFMDVTRSLAFVYGTLRKRGSNAWRMATATYVSEAMAHGSLYQITWYPGAVFDSTSPHWIHGELYEIEETHLHDLDQFEGEEYERIRIEVFASKEKREVWAWEYVRNQESKHLISSGDWVKEYRE